MVSLKERAIGPDHRSGANLEKVTKKAVPALMLLAAISAATPPLGAALARSLSQIPIAGPLANVSVSYGTMLRSKLGRR